MIMGQFSPMKYGREKKTYATASTWLLLKQTSTAGNFFAVFLCEALFLVIHVGFNKLMHKLDDQLDLKVAFLGSQYP